MDLRKRTIHALAGTGALLIVVGLSVGGGVALAVPPPPDQSPADSAKVPTAASDRKSSDGKASDEKSSGSKSNR
ncbi:MAG TPA: hypothetical protein VJS45_09200, partial [Acidimicrobiia bacterium]|nr:hypothetical protein [Acidimicrobiia bacterium]